MKLSDFDFDLPEALIATRPAKPRSSARLLVATPDAITDGVVTDLVDWFQAGDRLVLNDTKVLPARLTGKRGRDTAQGYQEAKIEVTLLEPQAEGGVWRALIKPLKKVKEGEVIRFSDDLSATLTAKEDGAAYVAFNLTGADFDHALNAAGSMPLPPYIEAKRKADAQDKDDYQTVWARTPGAVAAPTASLHFDEALLAALTAKGVEITHVTLHVGAGTFLPVKVDNVDEHKMHAEWGRGDARSRRRDRREPRPQGGRVIPVGTTALRLIESAARETRGDRRLSGRDGYFHQTRFRVCRHRCADDQFPFAQINAADVGLCLMGVEPMRAVYDHAVTQGYRFFSYGDASLLLPHGA